MAKQTTIHTIGLPGRLRIFTPKIVLTDVPGIIVDVSVIETAINVSSIETIVDVSNLETLVNF